MWKRSVMKHLHLMFLKESFLLQGNAHIATSHFSFESLQHCVIKCYLHADIYSAFFVVVVVFLMVLFVLQSQILL